MKAGEESSGNRRLRVVLTGGPSTGKTTLIRSLQELGYLCYPEEIRKLTQELLNPSKVFQGGENPLLLTSDSLDFNTRLLERRLGQWLDFNGQPAYLGFYDRGIPDVLAYMDAFGQVYPDHFQEEARRRRYDCVFFTPIWPEIFVNDTERMESLETARLTEAKLLATYIDLGYDPIPIPLVPVEERIDFVLRELGLC